jgi:MFS superfamily sulfate permease-like transporter
MRYLAQVGFWFWVLIHLSQLSLPLDAPLFFANAELFKERVSEAVAASPTAVNWVVVAAEPVTDIDLTSSDSLAELVDVLRAKGITFRFAELKDPVRDQLKRFGLFAEFARQLFTQPLVLRYMPILIGMTLTGKTMTSLEKKRSRLVDRHSLQFCDAESGLTVSRACFLAKPTKVLGMVLRRTRC